MHGHRKGKALVRPGNAGPGTFPSYEFDHARAKVILQESTRPMPKLEPAAAESESDVGRLLDCEAMGDREAHSPTVLGTAMATLQRLATPAQS